MVDLFLRDIIGIRYHFYVHKSHTEIEKHLLLFICELDRWERWLLILDIFSCFDHVEVSLQECDSLLDEV